MKKSSIVSLCLILLAVITASSFAIYKSTLNGTIQANCAETIAEVVTQETDPAVINSNSLTLDYDFTVNNYITENSNNIRNQVVSNYYIKITGLESNVFSNNVKLYYMDPNAGGTELSLLTEGSFNGYYKTNKQLVIDSDVSHSYKLQITIPSANLIDFTTEVNIDIGYEQDIEIEKHVNSPELTTGMIPVAWDDLNDVWVKTDSANIEDCWYNYDQKKWANIVTALSNYNDGTNSGLSYSQAPNGTTIPYSDITTMFVWIPRFVYRIDENYYHTVISGSEPLQNPPVEIHFSKTQNTGGDEWDNNIIVVNSGTEAEDCKDTWTTHSAFTFGDTYLNGIWIAKFQGSLDEDNNIVYIKPAATIKKAVGLDESFKYCRNMETKSIYGLETASTLTTDGTFETDNNGLDIHLTKNSEWSAVAFLAHSKYGQGIQNIQNSSPLLASSNYAGQISTVELVFSQQIGQATTNNVYGVYDMSSAVWDWVSAYIGDGATTHTTAVRNALPKYKNIFLAPEGQSINYSNQSSVYSIFEHIKDAAIWETSISGNATNTAWFSGRSNIGYLVGNKYNQLIARGGQRDGVDSIFSFGYGDGTDVDNNGSKSFRPIIVVGIGL